MPASPKHIAILKETRDADRRVILLPDAVRRFVADGFDVAVEQGAGAGLDIGDHDYQAVGARMVSTDEAWGQGRFLVKYRYPAQGEWHRFRPDTHLCAWFYPGETRALTNELCRRNVTAYTYEFFRTDSGHFPLMGPDSEISGRLAVIEGAHLLLNTEGGRGVLLAHVPGARRARVLVIGHGNAGGAAARTAAALGAEVTVLGHRVDTLRRFAAAMPADIRCEMNTPEALERLVPDADLVVGAILISTYDTPTMVAPELVARMRPGSVIVDVTCGYGSGWLPSASKVARYGEPAQVHHGVLHVKNDVMPMAVHRSCAEANSANMTPYLLALGNAIFNPARPDPVSQAGKFVERGRVIHPVILHDYAVLDGQAAE
ncbi:NAD(P)-dependent oxidoreductase (plasmid) [Tistrella bauzanensis]|uniref:NAD(P)-dependent oxidoreductase n=1 Tax=Tistrella arctica TaxID=3133430 RepID=A0ABU9YNA6_9PROT